MLFIAIIVIILLVYFLIIRPLAHRNRPQIMVPRRDFYDRPDYYGPSPINGGFGRFGTFAGGIAAGALLTYLFEQGRIGFDQYQLWQNWEDHEIIKELMDQNILQEHEIAQLQEELDQGKDGQADWGMDQRDDVDFDPNDDWDNSGDDNWV